MIGFDASPLSPQHRATLPLGVQRAIHGTLEALEQRGNLPLVRLAPEAHERTALGRWRRRGLPRQALARGVRGVHSFLSSLAFQRVVGNRRLGPVVQTLHELPWLHGVAENADGRHRFWARAGMVMADRVVVPSAFVLRDASRGRLLGKDRLRVVPWGVGPPFQAQEPDGVVDELVLERYRLGVGPFVLALGAVRPKKRLDLLLEGLAERHRRGEPPLSVVVTGEDTPELRRCLGLAAKLGLSRFVSTIGIAEEADLPSLMRLASAVVVLSRSEGFGFPALEAAACGTPAVVAAETAPAELLDGAGIAVRANDPSAVADGLERALQERRTLRRALLERAATFSWDRTAEALEALWSELV